MKNVFIKVSAIILIVFAMGYFTSCEYNDPYYYYPTYGNTSNPAEKTIEFTGNILSSDSLLPLEGISVQLISEYYYLDTNSTFSDSLGNFLLENLSFEGEDFNIYLSDPDSIFKDTIFGIEIEGRDFVTATFTTTLQMSKY